MVLKGAHGRITLPVEASHPLPDVGVGPVPELAGPGVLRLVLLALQWAGIFQLPDAKVFQNALALRAIAS